MLLGLKTDNPLAELYLYSSEGFELAKHIWQADRELARTLLEVIDTFLRAQGKTVHGMSGLFVFEGPGSFTGLRIGITVMNTLAVSLGIPIVGERDDDWKERAAQRLNGGENDHIVMPFYGADARVTQSKKS